MATQRKLNQDMYAKIFKLLMERPVSAHEISEKVGMHIVNAQGLMRCFRDNGVVHIYSWRTDSKGRDATPVYVLGEGVDKPRRSLTRAQIAVRYRIRKQEKEKAAKANKVRSRQEPNRA